MNKKNRDKIISRKIRSKSNYDVIYRKFNIKNMSIWKVEN